LSVAQFLDQLSREAAEGAAGGNKIEVVGAHVVKTGALTPGTDSKVRRAVDYAFVTLELAVTQNGEQRGSQLQMMFLRTDAGWRFSPTM
jgi:hypothetical protein